MSLRLDIPTDLEVRLTEEAQRRGLSVPEYTLQVLSRHVPSKDHRVELVALLQSWIDDPNTREQQEVGDFLVRSLDEDRPSERKLFPSDLEGKTW